MDSPVLEIAAAVLSIVASLLTIAALLFTSTRKTSKSPRRTRNSNKKNALLHATGYHGRCLCIGSRVDVMNLDEATLAAT